MKRSLISKNHIMFLLVALLLGSTVFAQQWSTSGNVLSNGDFLGSTNNFPLIFKTNGGARLYITETGYVGIGTSTPAQMLDVSGNVNVNGTISANCISSACLNIAGNITIDNATISHIFSPDGVVHFGDSSVTIDYDHNVIAQTNAKDFTGSGVVKGLRIGRVYGAGNNLKNAQLAYGSGSIAMGFYAGTGANAINSICMGSGSLTESLAFVNNDPNSLWVGFNTTIPTLFVGTANGSGTVGKVGIGTNNPQQTLDVNGIGRFGNANGHVEVQFNTVHGIIDADHDLLINFYSQKKTYIGPGDLIASGKMRVGNRDITSGPHQDYKLSVDGKIVASSCYITTTGWADYVFDSDYELPKLERIENFYKTNKHLPEIPTEKEVKEKGINVAEMNILLLKKIEELTLYIVDLS
ncbi:MAG: hypothetical protein IT235_00240 [Bacteroidia bacterium]|nr:hypothetical protein [Bacteroidia bacterium]